jgi:hypothetical protein
MRDTAATVDEATAGQAMTAEQRAGFERDGYLLVAGVLDARRVAFYASVLDDLYQRQRRNGLLDPDLSTPPPATARGPR